MSDQSMIKSFSMREEFLTVCMYVPTVKSVLTYQTFTSCGVSAHAPDATKSEQEKNHTCFAFKFHFQLNAGALHYSLLAKKHMVVYSAKHTLMQ